MAKITDSYCSECKKSIKEKNIIEIDVVFTCPDCGKSYIDQWEADEIECTNPECYTSKRSLLVDTEIAKHTQAVADKTGKIDDLKPKDLKQHMESIRTTTNTFKASLDKRKDKDFDHSKVKYDCYHCGHTETNKKWDTVDGKCPKCKKDNYVIVETEPKKFITHKSKHIVAVCPKFHVLARYPRRD